MSEIFNSTDRFKECFNLAERPEYVEVTAFSKGIGFSVQRAYPETSRFKPPQKRDGTLDTYALISVLYETDKASPRETKQVPISVRVSAFSRYISNHLDYDFDDPECPTEESVTVSKKTPKPLDLTQRDEYAYDHLREAFIDSDGKPIEGMKIIDSLYGSHVATVDKFRGRILRWRLSSRSKACAGCEVFSDLLKGLLKHLFGRTLQPDEPARGIWGDYRPEDVKLLKSESIDVFGYRASKNVIVTFCILLLVGYSIIRWANLSFPWLTGVAENNLLAIACCILLIAFLDDIVPKILRRVINGINSIEFWLISRNLKFK